MSSLTYALMNSLAPEEPRRLPFDPASLQDLGAGLQRPECVLATRDGSLYTADWRGGVAELRADGSQALYLADRLPPGLELRPNGIALLRDGSFLLAQLGDEDGGVWRLWRDGRCEPWCLAVDGRPLPPTNYVVQDAAGRTWITVSTRRQPRALGYRADCDDGFIVCVDPRGARVAADGLGYTNEVAVDPSGRWLYANETFARRLSRFALAEDGTLGPRQTVTEFGAGCFPDGLALDVEGQAWVVSIVSNRLIRVAPDGRQTLWLEDADPAHLAEVEAAYRAGAMGRPHLDGIRSQRLRNISSIAFAGPDRRTAVLGNLLDDHLYALRLPVAGLAPLHWSYPL